MPINHHNARAQQQRRINVRVAQSDSYAFFNLLTGPAFLDQVESLLPEHRERLFPPTETLSMFLAQALSADRSCQNAVNDSAIKRLAGGLPLCSTATGAYCQARQRLPLEMVSRLTTLTGRQMAEQVPERWRWRGRPVRLVDGTTVTMPDTAARLPTTCRYGCQVSPCTVATALSSRKARSDQRSMDCTVCAVARVWSGRQLTTSRLIDCVTGTRCRGAPVVNAPMQTSRSVRTPTTR